MPTLTLDDPRALAAALEVFASSHPVFMLQLPSVYALVAPPHARGVEALHRAKDRLAGKHYGTAIGRSDAFWSMAMPGSLPDAFAAPSSLDLLTGAFVRVAVCAPGVDTAAVCQGTHQGLLLDGPFRELVVALEAASLSSAEPALMGGHRYGAPLCTSANLSGDPLGSITDWDRARAFAEDRGVELVIRAPAARGSAGSYPIFALERERIFIARHGPGEDEIRARLPAHLFARGGDLR
jgi:tRNA A37 threonylcarbamoyladenosine synthetase subunit TsaC/SUA5/YrdC